MLPWILCGLTAALLLAALIKIHLMKKDLRDLTRQTERRLTEDTNVPLRLKTGDAAICSLAATLNRQLDTLREHQLKYITGDRELRDAVTNISHDLRTPLTAVSGYLELLSAEALSADARRYLAVIGSRTEQMRQLTEELFRYSLILSADGGSAPETVCVNALLEECIAGYYAVLMQRGITPEISLPETRILCQCSRTALERVFTNLLHNALKYSSGDLMIKAEADGTICFANHTAEMDRTHLAHLFDRFYTVESAQHSTGLGLAIAKTVMEQMGGSITAHVEENLLSIVLRLPELKEGSPAGTDPAAESPEVRSMPPRQDLTI